MYLKCLQDLKQAWKEENNASKPTRPGGKELGHPLSLFLSPSLKTRWLSITPRCPVPEHSPHWNKKLLLT